MCNSKEKVTQSIIFILATSYRSRDSSDGHHSVNGSGRMSLTLNV